MQALNAQGIDLDALGQREARRQGENCDWPSRGSAGRGHFESAARRHELHAEVARRGGDRRGGFVAAVNLSVAYGRLGRMRESAHALHGALELVRAERIPAIMCIAAGLLGLLSFEQGDFETARACLLRHEAMCRRWIAAAASAAERATASEALCDAKRQLGRVAMASGDYETAHSHLGAPRAVRAGEEQPPTWEHWRRARARRRA